VKIKEERYSISNQDPAILRLKNISVKLIKKTININKRK
jgi:hypothetical protein